MQTSKCQASGYPDPASLHSMYVFNFIIDFNGSWLTWALISMSNFVRNLITKFSRLPGGLNSFILETRLLVDSVNPRISVRIYPGTGQKGRENLCNIRPGLLNRSYKILECQKISWKGMKVLS